MQAVGAVVLVAAALLAVGGVAKVWKPLPAVLAMRAQRLPVSPSSVRLLGATEVALAVAAVATGWAALLLAMAATYLAFAGFVVATMRSSERRSCGCFGEAATPPGGVHVVVNVAAAAASVLAAVVTIPSLGEMLEGGPLRSGLVILATVLAVYLLVALLTTLPQAMAAVAEAGRSGR